MLNKFKDSIKNILINSTILSYKENFIRQNTAELKISLKNFNLINKKLIGGGDKQLTINYLDEKYIFECFDDSDSEVKMYMLYAKNNDSECVVLSINKSNNESSIYNLSTDALKCSDTLITNIGTHLVKIVIALIIKYLNSIDFVKTKSIMCDCGLINLFAMQIDLEPHKDKLNINKILVSDHSFLYCPKIKNNIVLSDIQILKTGHTFYGKLGFVPFDEKLKRKYNKNLEIINNLTVENSNMIHYLNKFQNKYTNIDISSVINSANKHINDKFTDFFIKLSNKQNFDNNCELLNYIIPKLFKHLHLTSFYYQPFIYMVN